MSEKKKPPIFNSNAPKKIPETVSHEKINEVLKECQLLRNGVSSLISCDGRISTIGLSSIYQMELAFDKIYKEIYNLQRMLSAIQWELHNVSHED